MFNALVTSDDIVRYLLHRHKVEELVETTEKNEMKGVEIAKKKYEINAKMIEKIEKELFETALQNASNSAYGSNTYEEELPSIDTVKSLLGCEIAQGYRCDLEKAEDGGITLNMKNSFGLCNKSRMKRILREFNEFVYSQ